MSGIYLWVEGDDDSRFLESIFLPHITSFDFVQIQKYSSMKVQKVKAFLHSIDRMAHCDLIFFGDLDQHQSVQARQANLRSTYNVPERFPVVVVCREVEGWYLAGLESLLERRMWLGGMVDVNQLEKEQFNRGQPARFKSRIDWMIELLKVHAREIAKGRSPSFTEACALLQL